MLKALLKKQMMELYQSFFQNKKTGKARSKSSVIALIVLYAILIVVFLGGIFTLLSITVCRAFLGINLAWMYFTVLGVIAIVLGVFGSVFSTYSGLYQAKDNDLLLSMPIPEKYILISRLISVYLMGLLFSGIVIIPAVIVYFVMADVTFSAVIGSILLILLISVFVLTLSCILGWVVAKISNKLKNKSFITVIVSVAFFGAYYYVFYNANNMINKIVENSDTYSTKIKGFAYPLYLMGMTGAGDVESILIFTVAVLAFFALVCYVMAKTFIKTVTANHSGKKIKYKEKEHKLQGTYTALVKKEIKRFTSSANYMLNCSLGTLFLIVAAVAVLIKGNDLLPSLEALAIGKDMIGLIACGIICFIITMNDITAPSVSLDAKTMWISHSLPVKSEQILFSKVIMHCIFTMIPSFICSVCVAIVLKPGFLMSLMIIFLPLALTLLIALFGLFMNLHLPNQNWTSEIMAIKQGMSVLFTILLGWVYAVLISVACGFASMILSLPIAMLIASLITVALSVLLIFWIKNKGTKIYDSL